MIGKRPTLTNEILEYMMSETIKIETNEPVFFTAYKIAKALTKRTQISIVKEVLERMSNSYDTKDKSINCRYKYDESHDETHWLHDGCEIVFKKEENGKESYALNPRIVTTFRQNDINTFSKSYKELITEKGLEENHRSNIRKKKIQGMDKSKK